LRINYQSEFSAESDKLLCYL